MRIYKCFLLPGALLCGAFLAGCQSNSLARGPAEVERTRADFFVSASGSDHWSGKLAEANAARTDGPFRTLARARDAVRLLKEKEKKKDILVLLGAGPYPLEQTLVFSLEDAALPGGSITYAACKGEIPVVHSFVSFCFINNHGNLAPTPGNSSVWKKPENPSPLLPAVARDQVWTMDTPECLPNILSLYYGNTRLPRASSRPFAPRRIENQNAAPPDQLAFPPGTMKTWPDLRNGELRVIPNCDYEMCLLPLAEVDELTGIARTTGPASRPMGPVKFMDETVWVENILEVLDEPGEWVFNAAERKLYLWPLDASSLYLVNAPRLTELIRVEGEIDYDGPTDRPVNGLIFRGITFTGGERLPWDGATKGELQHKWEHFDRPSALLRFRGAQRCIVDSCRFMDSSGAGLRLDLSCQDNRVVNNEMARLGGVGILLAGYGPGTKDTNKHNEVTNNWVHDIGQNYWASPAIMIWQSGGNQITHNLIHDTPYTGITVSGRTGWTPETEDTFRAKEVELPAYETLPSASAGSNLVHREWWAAREKYMHARKNFVAYNEIHDVMKVMGDGNGIYISGTGRENHIYQNYIHHIDGDGAGAGIRCDNDQYETIVEGNVLYRNRSTQSGIATTEMNHILGNIIVDILPSRRKITPPNIVHGYLSIPDPTWPFAGARIQRNIVWSSRKDYWPIVEHKSFSTGAGERLIGTETDCNLYWCPEDPQWGQRHIDVQKTHGVETHSLSADPMFIDLENGDLQLSPDSPAWRLGFQPIDLAKTGLRTEHPFFGGTTSSRASRD